MRGDTFLPGLALEVIETDFFLSAAGVPARKSIVL
jgi:hypothetical protein